VIVKCDLIVMSSLHDSCTSSINTSDEFNYVIEGILSNKGTKVVVNDPRFRDQLRNKGFGDVEGTEYILKSYEALYLINMRRLTLRRTKNGDINFDSFFNIVLRYDKEILTRFLIYRDLRSRGYVAKDGFGFGIDFRLYERGEFGKKPAKFVVFAVIEGIDTSVGKLSQVVEQIEKMGKESILAVIERRGEIIYYKATRLRFNENKALSQSR
jgi:tRNA-intron endonuclease